MTENENMDDKRSRILKAALEVIAENGFHNSPTSFIARRAGVSVGLIYRYFENKDQLIEETYRIEDEKLDQVVFAKDSETFPIRERVKKIFTRFIRHMMEHPQILFFMEQYYNSPYGIDKKREELESGEKHCQSFARLLDHGKSQQIIKNMDNEILFSLGFGPIVFLIRDHKEGLIHLDDDIVSEVVDMCWNALKL